MRCSLCRGKLNKFPFPFFIYQPITFVPFSQWRVHFLFLPFAPREDFVSAGGNAADQPTHFSVGVQTDYRESETQTDPYSPAYVIRDGTTPSELLQLAAFTWGTRATVQATPYDTLYSSLGEL